MIRLRQYNNYLTVFLAILCSGSAMGMIYSQTFYPLYFIAALIGLSFSIEHNKVSINNLFIWTFFILFYLLHFAFFTRDSADANSYIGNIILLTSAFLLSMQVTNGEFRAIFTNIMVVIAAYCLLMYILGITIHLSKYAANFNSMPILGLFNYTDIIRFRNSGIFWEPGVYQIFLNFSILFIIERIMNKNSDGKLDKRDFFRFCLLVISVLTTLSTTGYICLCLIAIYFLLRKYANINLTQKIFLIFPFLLILGLLIYITINNPTVYNKLFKANVSTQIRLNDFTQSPKIIMKSPFLGFGSGTQMEQYQNSIYGIQYNSVGIFLSAIRYGCIYICLYIYKIFKGIYQKLFNIRYIMLITMIAVFFTEGMFEFAIMYLFIFEFLKDSKSITQIQSNTSDVKITMIEGKALVW